MSENPITTRLIDCIKKHSDAAVDRLLTLALSMVDAESVPITICPYCGSRHIVRNGKKYGKQRFLCRSCDRTYVTTTHTLLSMSHSPASVWKEVISDTLRGDAIDFTADRQYNFNQPMRLHMNPNNRLGKMADNIPWDEFEIKYAGLLCCCGMGLIVTKLKETQLTSTALSVFVMNLFTIQKRILCSLIHPYVVLWITPTWLNLEMA